MITFVPLSSKCPSGDLSGEKKNLNRIFEERHVKLGNDKIGLLTYTKLANIFNALCYQLRDDLISFKKWTFFNEVQKSSKINFSGTVTSNLVLIYKLLFVAVAEF